MTAILKVEGQNLQVSNNIIKSSNTLLSAQAENLVQQ